MAKWVLFRFVFMALLLSGILLIVSYFAWNSKKNEKERATPSTVSDQKPKQKAPGEVKFEDAIFPEKFFFGTASSDFQTTGGTGLSDWNKYINECLASKKCKTNSEEPFVGPDYGTRFLSRYKEDFDLAEKFGDQMHRLSLEWARIEPEEGKWDEAAIEKYREIFLYMRSKGIEPMICANHFALPLWMSEKGGLAGPKFPFYYSRYISKIVEKLGVPLKIRWWLTFNEPQVMLIPYTKGMWPPDKPIKSPQDLDGVQRAMGVASNIIDAHRLSYRAIHKKIPSAMVSYASAPGQFYPKDPNSPLDQTAYTIGTALDTLAFDYAVGRVDRDFIGLNYYGRVKLKFYISILGNTLPWLTKEKPWAMEWEMPVQRKQGNRPKEFYPRALYDLIMKFKDLNLPVVITENGLSDAEDQFREEFMIIHLKAVHDAIKDGVPVIGYQYWALTDTWEWDGVFSQMGLISIDRNNNLERKLRPSALTYGEIIKTRTIKKELLEKYKELLINPEMR